MSKKKVGYPFKPGHAKTPSEWRELRWFKRSLLRELWMMSEDGSIDTSGAADPLARCVRDLDIHDRHDRHQATKALRELASAGLLTVSKGVVSVRLTVACAADLTVRRPADDHSNPTSGRLTEAKPLKPIISEIQRDQIKIRSEKRDRARAPETGWQSDGEPSLTPEAEARNERAQQMVAGLRWYCEVTGRIEMGCRRSSEDEAAFVFIGSRGTEERVAVRDAIRGLLETGKDQFFNKAFRKFSASYFQNNWIEFCTPPEPAYVFDPGNEMVDHIDAPGTGIKMTRRGYNEAMRDRALEEQKRQRQYGEQAASA